MGFMTYDLIFLALFVIFVVIFLYKRRANLKREMGIAFLYPTTWGIKFIDKFTEKYGKILKPLRFLIIATGVLLMVIIVIFLTEATYLYLKLPRFTNAPPVAPLIPYFPQIFGLQAFFPPLYFTYFIVAVSIAAVVHEFSHGIYSRLANLKIKSTGFLFLGPFLGAFVEPDEKKMLKAKKVDQLSILGAGVFSNVILTFVFGGLLVLFFTTTFHAAGVGFNTYATAVINTSQIIIPHEQDLNNTLINISVDGKIFLISPNDLKYAGDMNYTQMVVYEDAPAIRAGLPGSPDVISEFDGVKVTSYEQLGELIRSKKPGDTVNIQISRRDGVFDTQVETEDYEIELGERDGKAYLGIGVIPASAVLSKFSVASKFNFIFTGFGTWDLLTYYESSWGEFGWFIYFLLWWCLMINSLLALFNMLPLGPFDGGRFFQLCVEKITGSEKIGKKAFKVATWFILALLIILVVDWAVGFFV
jgi:membrane-associated protease RseP (regulator of RpoE activity)